MDSQTLKTFLTLANVKNFTQTARLMYIAQSLSLIHIYLAAGIFANGVYGVGNAAVNWGAALVNNLLPVTIGNIIGGALIGITYWFLYLRGAKKN